MCESKESLGARLLSRLRLLADHGGGDEARCHSVMLMKVGGNVKFADYDRPDR